MNPAEILVGAFTGSVASELLKPAIEEAKKVSAFEELYKELRSRMNSLLPIVTQIDPRQEDGELKNLYTIIARALEVLGKCSGVHEWDAVSKKIYAEEIEEINREMGNFCKVQLSLLMFRNQRSSVSPTVYTDLCSVRKPDTVPVGMDWPLMKLKKKVLDDSLDSFLVSAPPGCGKTTLVTHLCHDQEIKGKFKHIFFCVVSSTPNFKAIVQNLLQHNGHAPLTLENDMQAFNALGTLLEKLKEGGRPILLVLDDVWPGAESLLEYFRIKIPGYKILVTSRVDLPGFSHTHRLKPLKDEDAKALLVTWASRPAQGSQAEYEDLLEKILKRCNGFPLVIKVVGGSLKTLSLTQWQGQMIIWSKGRTVLDNPRPTVLDRLQPSFDSLDPDLKQCFLDMGSFLEDQKIRASVIIDIWAELYGNGMTEKDKIILCMKYLEDLATHNLIDLVHLGKKDHQDGFYFEYLVTQHDILRELAIYQSKSEENLERKRLNLEIRGNEFPDWCLDPMQSINARLLSISTDDSFSSKWIKMNCPNVEALVLNLSSSDYTLPSFIATMKKLKVFTVMSHGFFSARLSNFCYLSSLPNLRRIRLEKVSITWLDLLQLQLGSLKKLSVVMCSFGEAVPKETDVSKALPSLQEVDMDYCYDLVELPFWVSEVVSLKSLSITNCNKLTKLPEAIGNLSKLEVLRLSSCINLSELPETTERLRNLQFLDISHCLELRKLPLEIGKLQKLKKISMIKCPKCELPNSVMNLKNLEVKCDEETRTMLWERLKTKMTNLRVEEEETEHNLNLLKMF